MTEELAAAVAAMLSRPMLPEVRMIAERLAAESGAAAVLFYGSNLRTGSLDGVLDFYVLLPGAAERGIWPAVGYREFDERGVTLRAKIATMRLATFALAAADGTVDTTIWTRFAQPTAIAWARDPAPVVAAVAAAARTAARYAAALGPAAGSASDYWRALFRATYAAELRVERGGRSDQIVEHDPDHYAALLPLAWAADGIAFAREGERLAPDIAPARRAALLRRWNRRRRLGRPINVARLVRAAFTFDGAARYGAWKVERHTGIPVPLTPWRERHPVLAAPGVLWRVWRQTRRQA